MGKGGEEKSAGIKKASTNVVRTLPSQRKEADKKRGGRYLNRVHQSPF